MADLAKIRREAVRWMILLTLNNASPVGAFESIVLSVVQAEYPTRLRMRYGRIWTIWRSGI